MAGLSVIPAESLKKRQDFLALRQAPRFSCPALVLQGFLINDGSTPLEVGYTVTKKTGNAVERNRIKRRLRMAFAEAIAIKVKATPGKNTADEKPHGGYGGQVVVVARRTALTEPYGLLVANLTKGIDRLVAKGKKAH